MQQLQTEEQSLQQRIAVLREEESLLQRNIKVLSEKHDSLQKMCEKQDRMYKDQQQRIDQNEYQYRLFEGFIAMIHTSPSITTPHELLMKRLIGIYSCRSIS